MTTTITEPEVTLQLAIEHGLSPEEYDRICQILNRVPTYSELGVFSVMWSEHCSYKNSILELKILWAALSTKTLKPAGSEPEEDFSEPLQMWQEFRKCTC